MADLTITAANVKTAATSNGSFTVVQVGEAVTRGQVGYRKASDGKYYLAKASGTLEESQAAGIFQTPAALNGYAILQKGGDIDPGATLTVAQTYVVSATAGNIAPLADISTTNHYLTILGIASAAGNLPLDINATGVQVP